MSSFAEDALEKGNRGALVGLLSKTLSPHAAEANVCVR
jgi:hypothetical protein